MSTTELRPCSLHGVNAYEIARRQFFVPNYCYSLYAKFEAYLRGHTHAVILHVCVRVCVCVCVSASNMTVCVCVCVSASNMTVCVCVCGVCVCVCVCVC